MRHDLSRRHGHAIRTPPPGHAASAGGGVSTRAARNQIRTARLRARRRIHRRAPLDRAAAIWIILLKPWAFGPTTTKYSVLPAPLVKRGYPLVRERAGADQNNSAPCAGRPGAECFLGGLAGDLRRRSASKGELGGTRQIVTGMFSAAPTRRRRLFMVLRRTPSGHVTRVTVLSSDCMFCVRV
jgi:hypothetical protein